MQRQELELEKNQRLAEIAERKEMQEMEARLAHAELIEQYEVDSDDQRTEYNKTRSDETQNEMRSDERQKA